MVVEFVFVVWSWQWAYHKIGLWVEKPIVSKENKRKKDFKLMTKKSHILKKTRRVKQKVVREQDKKVLSTPKSCLVVLWYKFLVVCSRRFGKSSFILTLTNNFQLWNDDMVLEPKALHKGWSWWCWPPTSYKECSGCGLSKTWTPLRTIWWRHVKIWRPSRYTKLCKKVSNINRIEQSLIKRCTSEK